MAFHPQSFSFSQGQMTLIRTSWLTRSGQEKQRDFFSLIPKESDFLLLSLSLNTLSKPPLTHTLDEETGQDLKITETKSC